MRNNETGHLPDLDNQGGVGGGRRRKRKRDKKGKSKGKKFEETERQMRNRVG